MEESEEFKPVNKKDIEIPSWLPRKPLGGENLKDEDDNNLLNSIDSVGLINPITLRIKENGKYELVAGSRRLGATKGDTVMAKIKKMDDFEAMMTCLAENYHRKDIDFVERDNFVYMTYIKGLESGKIKSKLDLAKKMGIGEGTLNKIISAGEERKKNDDDEIIQKASTNSLYATKSLCKTPLIRKKILEMEQKKVVNMKNMPDVTRQVKACLNEGMNEKMVSKVIDLVVPRVEEIKVINTENGKSVTDNISIGFFDPKKFKDITSTMITSHPDIREKIVNKKVSLEAAKEINKFETREAREQMIEENIKIEKWKEKSGQLYDNEWKENVDVRKQQEQDVKNSGDTNIKTRFDLEHQRKLEMEKTKDQRYDEEYIRRYQGIKSDVNGLIAHFHPRKLKTDKGKKIVPDIIKGIYALLRQVLIEIGEIKISNGTDGLDFVDIKDVKAEYIKDEKINDDVVIVKTP